MIGLDFTTQNNIYYGSYTSQGKSNNNKFSHGKSCWFGPLDISSNRVLMNLWLTVLSIPMITPQQESILMVTYLNLSC